MRVHRFFVKKPLGEEFYTEDVSLLHQLKDVLRLKIDNTLIFFNGESANDYLYRITAIDKKRVSFTCVESIVKDTILPTVHLYLASIKKDNFETAAQKATELGVTDITPIISERSFPVLPSISRLSLIVKEASEQSGRTTLPRVHEAVSLKALLPTLTPARTFALSLRGTAPHSFFRSFDTTVSLHFLVGPEGGWSKDEEALFTSFGIQCISISPLVLRAETAAMTCVYLSTLLRK